MRWGADDWLRTEDGQGLPSVVVAAPDLPAHAFAKEPRRDDFDTGTLPAAFQWLRTPLPDELFSLTERPGYLRLFGRDSIGSVFRQSLVARRQDSHCFGASTRLEFEPEHFQQAAGLVCYYGGAKFHYLYVSHDEAMGKHLRVMSALPDQVQADAFSAPLAVPPGQPIELRVEVDQERLLFAYRLDGSGWQWLPQQLDASALSDEATAPGAPNFTGAFVGLACQDTSGAACPADFDWFEYEARDYRPDPRS
jgi:xylan 1,4-beta-xylosidase